MPRNLKTWEKWIIILKAKIKTDYRKKNRKPEQFQNHSRN